MGKTLYRYNADTCQYERVRVKIFDVIFTVCGILVTALFLLAGMLALHDYLIDSEKEIALRKENRALRKNHATLSTQLKEIETTLVSLAEEDRKLHNKFFGTYDDEEITEEEHTFTKRPLLLANVSGFTNAVKKIKKKSERLFKLCTTSNEIFLSNLIPHTELIEKIHSLPTLQPVQPWHNDKLLSGFGMRVNPFHKGLYEHPGIDIAVPRGTEVMATASGVVVEVKQSNLQAGYGNFIRIDHGQGITTLYAHLEEVKVRRGQQVAKGTVIGTSGNSGGSIAPHLHYEIIKENKNTDPVAYMIEGLSSTAYEQLKSIGQKQNQSLD